MTYTPPPAIEQVQFPDHETIDVRLDKCVMVKTVFEISKGNNDLDGIWVKVVPYCNVPIDREHEAKLAEATAWYHTNHPYGPDPNFK